MKTLVDLSERPAAQHSDRPAFVTHKFPSWLRWQVVRSLRRLLISGFGNRLRGFGASLLGNGFPFVKEGSGVRESLEYVGKMLEQGWNVLIFPEGKLTVIGPTEPFKSGIGLLAVETGASVLQTRIDVLRAGFYEGKWLPHVHARARVRASIGQPVRVPFGTDYAKATAILEQAVRDA